jgi:hypothetical protein
LTAPATSSIGTFGSTPLQGGLGHRADVFGAAVHPLGHHAVDETEFCGDHNLVAEGCHRFADQRLVHAWAIGLRRVEEGHATLECRPDQGNSGLRVGCRAVAVAQAHAAETEGRDFKTAIAKDALFHRSSLSAACAALGVVSED